VDFEFTERTPAGRLGRYVESVWHARGQIPYAREKIAPTGSTVAGIRGKERTSEIAALEPGRSVTLRSRQGGVTADYTYRVEPAGPGGRVTLVADVASRGAWALAGPAIRAAIRRTDAGQLDAFDRELSAT
jgi:hypothetical protein